MTKETANTRERKEGGGGHIVEDTAPGSNLRTARSCGKKRSGGKMTVCAMFGCKNRRHKGCGKHFFRFPMKDPERLSRWIEAAQRDDWNPSIHSKICSDHFTEKHYMIRPGAACPYLRMDAVPTPLYPAQRKKKTKKRKYTRRTTRKTAESEEIKAEDTAQETPSETGASGSAGEEKETQSDAQAEKRHGEEEETHKMEEGEQGRILAAEIQGVKSGDGKRGEKQAVEGSAVEEQAVEEEPAEEEPAEEEPAEEEPAEEGQAEEEQAVEGQIGKQAVEGQIGKQAVEGQVGQQAVEGQVGQQAVEGQVEQQAVEGQVGQQAVEGQVGQQAVKGQAEGQVGQQAVEGQVEQQAVEGQVEQQAVEGQVEQQAVEGQVGKQAVEGQVGQQAVEGQVEQQAVEGQVGKQAVASQGEKNEEETLCRPMVETRSGEETQVEGQGEKMEVEGQGEQQAVETRDENMESQTQSDQQEGERVTTKQPANRQNVAARGKKKGAGGEPIESRFPDMTIVVKVPPRPPCANVSDYIPVDHAYSAMSADKENDVPAPVAVPKVVKFRRKIKALQKQVLRQGVKIKNLKKTLVDLRKNNMMERDPEQVIAEHCSGLTQLLFTQQMKNGYGRHSVTQYCSLMKEFALNLYYASPKAYKFCRLFLSLPHPVSLRHWKAANEGTLGPSAGGAVHGEHAPGVSACEGPLLDAPMLEVALQEPSGQEGHLPEVPMEEEHLLVTPMQERHLPVISMQEEHLLVASMQGGHLPVISMQGGHLLVTPMQGGHLQETSVHEGQQE
ncbi:uncharacterized protein LOC142661706 [Rhinoderma darwinii]|uniref:uncharacterized protein LOC142661706 n=1 Tax=Rhinoderma darwinii TaxID=43563 RepID=UPI003F66E5D7